MNQHIKYPIDYINSKHFNIYTYIYIYLPLYISMSIYIYVSMSLSMLYVICYIYDRLSQCIFVIYNVNLIHWVVFMLLSAKEEDRYITINTKNTHISIYTCIYIYIVYIIILYIILTYSPLLPTLL